MKYLIIAIFVVFASCAPVDAHSDKKKVPEKIQKEMTKEMAKELQLDGCLMGVFMTLRGMGVSADKINPKSVVKVCVDVIERANKTSRI